MKRGKSPNSPTHRKSRKLKPLQDVDIFIFPDEIITEILSRLPVKSILKFRCVSKSWLSLISSKQFIKTHLEVSTKDPSANGYRAILSVFLRSIVLKQCSIRTLLSYEQTSNNFSALNIDYPMRHPHDALHVEDSCNGLICIRNKDKDLFLWNPSIKESIKLPSIDITLDTPHYSVCGFGFDESNDDYKVVKIFCLYEADVGYKTIVKSIVNIYSLKTGCWKKVDDFNGGFRFGQSGKFANGKLHWFATSGVRSTHKWDILSLDLETELYGTVDQPNYDEGYANSTLGLLGGCICVICNYVNTRVDLWVLKEYGVKGSWSKTFSFTHNWEFGVLLYPNPMCMLPSGEILIGFGKSFIVCNPRYNSFRHIRINNLDTYHRSDVYVESLVSPVAYRSLQCQHQ